MRLVLLLLFTGFIPGALPAQPEEPRSAYHEKIIPLIEARLEQPGGDTARYFILELVRNHCRRDYDCLQNTYNEVLKKLEGQFKHFQGLLVAKEAGFDMEKYQIRMDRERLEAEQEKQALELSLGKTKLKSTIIIALLVALLALGLSFGLYKQRQAKMKLARQNELIFGQAEQLKNLDAAKSRFFAKVAPV